MACTKECRTWSRALTVRLVLMAPLFWGSPMTSVAEEAQARDLAPVTKSVDRHRIIELTRQLVRINSEYEYGVTHNHKEIADFIANELNHIGLQVTLVTANPEFPVVIGRLKGTGGGPSLGMVTHYNTVYVGNREKWTVDPFEAMYQDEDGKIWGRGASNSKGSVAADIETARAIIDSGVRLKGDLVLLFPPGEGATEFCLPWIVKNRPELIRADWYLGGGGGGDFTRAHAGHVWLKLISKGTQEHPPCPPPCVNAIDKMMKVLPAVARVEEWMTWEPHPLFGDRKPFAEVGKIAGGYQVNIVPDRVEADIDIRTVPTQTQEQIAKDLDALLARLKNDDPAIDIEVQWIWKQIVPFEEWFKVTEDDPIVQAIMEIAPKYTGRKPTWRKGVGGGAGRPDLWANGSKVIYFGVGRRGGGGAHGIDEWVSVDALVEKARFNSELAVYMLR